MRTRTSILTGMLLAFALAAAGDVMAAAPPGLGEGFAPKKSSKMLKGPKTRKRKAEAARPGAAPVILRPLSRDPTLSPAYDAAPRVGGLAAERKGGGQCRLTCANSYYVCLSSDSDGICGKVWTQCLTACPMNTSDN